jgi:hypothetical protein
MRIKPSHSSPRARAVFIGLLLLCVFLVLHGG